MEKVAKGKNAIIAGKIQFLTGNVQIAEPHIDKKLMGMMINER